MSRRASLALVPVVIGLGACFPFVLDTSGLVECVSNADCKFGTICYPNGSCDAGVPNGSSSGSSGFTQGSTASSSSGSNSNSSSNGTSGTTSGSSSNGSSGCGSSSGSPLQARVLATTDSFQGQIWDVTNPAAAQGIIGAANLQSDIPTAIAETTTPGDQEILVLLDTSGLIAFDSAGTFLGQIEVPVPSGTFQGGSGIAYVPQPCGATPVIVVCGDQVTGFRYPGRSAFSANGLAYIPLVDQLYSDTASGYNACVPGPNNTFFATFGSSVEWYDVLTDNPHGGGFTGLFAQSQGQVSGVAIDAAGEVFVAGDDGSNDGFVALFSSSGICKQARSGGSCTLTCSGGCAVGDPALTGLPLHAAASFNGVFLVTASNSSPNAMNTILQVDPTNALTVTNYYVGPIGTDFYGLFAAPQPL